MYQIFFLIDFIGFDIQIQTFDILNLYSTKYGLHLKTNLLSVNCIFFFYTKYHVFGISLTQIERTRTNFHLNLKPARSHQGIINEIWPVRHTCRDGENEQILTQYQYIF